MKTMTITREVKMYGTSLGIRLGIDCTRPLNLKEGSVIKATIEIEEKFNESDRYIIHCDTPIIVREDEDTIDCPICGKELNVNTMEVKQS